LPFFKGCASPQETVVGALFENVFLDEVNANGFTKQLRVERSLLKSELSLAGYCDTSLGGEMFQLSGRGQF
jgi:hypothetical protein